MTHLLYLSDTYRDTASAKVLDIRDHEKGTAIILDQTIFYPQGGGQPCDRGTITLPPLDKEGVGGDLIFNVEFVALDPDGIVWHIGQMTPPDKGDGSQSDPGGLIGKAVDLKIDRERRMTNTRCHSAGHLIDIAMNSHEALRHLNAGKSFHFPEGPYVEYQGEIENPMEYISALEAKCQEVIKADMAIIAEDLSPQEAQKRGIKSPPGKAARFVYFEGYESVGCGCGGTHTKTSGEIGTTTIRKISSKKGVTRVAYLTT